MKAIAIVAVALLSTACATIMNGSTQAVTIASEPPGATISVLGNELARTPATITLRRNQRHTILLWKQGYEERRVEVIGAPEHFVEATLGNLWNLFIGFYVDFLTGGAFELDPLVINATLLKQADRPSP